MVANTGNGSTVAFGTTTGFTPKVIAIRGPEFTREKLEDTPLDAAGFYEYLPDDLLEPGEFEIDYYYDQSASTFAPAAIDPETITITFPLKSGEGTAATLAGTGFVISKQHPTLANKERMVATLSIAFDGKTGPTMTAGSA